MNKLAKEQVTEVYQRYCHFFYEILKLEKPSKLNLFEHKKYLDSCIASQKKAVDKTLTELCEKLENCQDGADKEDLKQKFELLLIAGAEVQPKIVQDPWFFGSPTIITKDIVQIALNAGCSETAMRLIVKKTPVSAQHIKAAIGNNASADIILLLIKHLTTPLDIAFLEDVYSCEACSQSVFDSLSKKITAPNFSRFNFDFQQRFYIASNNQDYETFFKLLDKFPQGVIHITCLRTTILHEKPEKEELIHRMIDLEIKPIEHGCIEYALTQRHRESVINKILDHTEMSQETAQRSLELALSNCPYPSVVKRLLTFNVVIDGRIAQFAILGDRGLKSTNLADAIIPSEETVFLIFDQLKNGQLFNFFGEKQPGQVLRNYMLVMALQENDPEARIIKLVEKIDEVDRTAVDKAIEQKYSQTLLQKMREKCQNPPPNCTAS